MLNVPTAAHPTVLGFDVILIGTILAAIAAAAVALAIYAAITVKDPMAKRVKALNERREQLKAGIVTNSARRRQSLVRKNRTTEQMRDTLTKLKVLQESQIQDIQQKLAFAGIRKKEYAIAVIFARMVLPVVLGLIAATVFYWANTFADCSAPSYPGTRATPAFCINVFARSLRPIARIADGGGPTKTIPASAQACANSAFSDRNP